MSTEEDPESSDSIELHAGSFHPPGPVVARLVIAPEDKSIVDELFSKATGAGKQTYVDKLLEENKELREMLHRFQHGWEIESDYICGYGHELLRVIAERDELREKLERQNTCCHCLCLLEVPEEPQHCDTCPDHENMCDDESCEYCLSNGLRTQEDDGE